MGCLGDEDEATASLLIHGTGCAIIKENFDLITVRTSKLNYESHCIYEDK